MFGDRGTTVQIPTLVLKTLLCHSIAIELWKKSEVYQIPGRLRHFFVFAELAAENFTGEERMPNGETISGLQAATQSLDDTPLLEPSTPPLYVAASNAPVVANDDWGQAKIITNTTERLTLGNLLSINLLINQQQKMRSMKQWMVLMIYIFGPNMHSC